MTKEILCAFYVSTLACAQLHAGAKNAPGSLSGQGAALSGRNRFSVYDNNVSGAGADSSFLTRGLQYQNDLSLTLDSAGNTNARWALALDARFTDDRRMDSKEASLQRISYDRWSRGGQISVGDFYGNFTQYSLNQNIKGLRWTGQKIADVEVTVIGGMAKNRWDELWERGEFESLNRGVEAARVRWTGPMASEIGAQLVFTGDRRTAGSAADAYSQRLFGFSWALPSNSDLSISGESAWSGAGIDRQAAEDSSKWGGAHKISARAKLGRWRSAAEYENVTTDFITTIGAASSDLRRWLARNQIRVAAGIDALINASGYRNNLNGRGQDTVRTFSPEGGLRWSAAFNRPTLNLEAKIRQRRSIHSGGTAEQRNLSGVLSLSDQWGPLNGSLDYEHRNEARVGQQRNFRDLLGFGLSGFYRVQEITLRPFVKWDLDNDHNETASTDNAAAQAYFGLAAENIAPRLSASVSRRRSFMRQAGGDDVINKLWDLRCNYRVPWREGDSLEAGFKDNLNDFSTGSKNYRETVWEVVYVSRL